MAQGQNVVRETCESTCREARHVHVDQQAVLAAADSLSVEKLQELSGPKAFDSDLHFCDGTPLTVQYLLVVDALNFCFWPDGGELQYHHLSLGLKAAVLKDPSVVSAERLAEMTGPAVRELLGWKRDFPQQEERARLLREVGAGLLQHFGGQAATLVEAAGRSALALVGLIAQHFPGFRDHAVVRGRQVFFYKRAQIFVGDVWGAFCGQGLGAFDDIDQLTMFADYRVPVVLRNMGILRYTPQLEAKVLAKEELPAGGEEECEIRAATVVAVERLRQALADKHRGSAGVRLPHTIQLDWWLWEVGEKTRDTDPPHHRTLTIYY